MTGRRVDESRLKAVLGTYTTSIHDVASNFSSQAPGHVSMRSHPQKNHKLDCSDCKEGEALHYYWWFASSHALISSLRTRAGAPLEKAQELEMGCSWGWRTSRRLHVQAAGLQRPTGRQPAGAAEA